MGRSYYIYSHTSPSGKVYIGQTVNIKRRWGYNGEHYKNKKSDGSYVQASFARAIDKYGWDNFIHTIILEGIPKSEADYAEKYLIKWYKLHGLSYNISSGGEGCDAPRPSLTEEQKKKISERLLKNHPMRGKHWSPEALAKITEANRNRTYTPEQRAAMSKRARLFNTGRKHTEEAKARMSQYRKEHPETWIGGWNKQEVHQYDLEGNYVASYSSAMEAANAIGKNINRDIGRCTKGLVLSAGGYFWREKKVDYIDVSKYKIVKTPKGARVVDMSEEGKRKRRNGHGKPVNQYSLDGIYIATFPSVTDAKETLNYKGGGIEKCCKHLPRYLTAAGYKWEYDNGSNRINLKSKEEYIWQEGMVELTTH